MATNWVSEGRGNGHTVHNYGKEVNQSGYNHFGDPDCPHLATMTIFRSEQHLCALAYPHDSLLRPHGRRRGSPDACVSHGY